jgi:hypothetical protein
MDEEYYNWVHAPETTESDARYDGYRAYQHGLSCHDNPYNNNDEWDLHVAWSEGWSQAGWDD